MKQQFVEWNDRYSIDVQSVDEQHRGLFALTNDLHAACREGGNSLGEHFRDVLQKAVAYVHLHFSTEEDIMTRTKDPNLAEHQREHDAFVKKVLEGAANLEKSPDSASEDFVRFLRDWVLNHIATSDVKIGQHITQLKARGILKADAMF